MGQCVASDHWARVRITYCLLPAAICLLLSFQLQPDVEDLRAVADADRRPPGADTIGNIYVRSGNLPVAPSDLVYRLNDVAYWP